MAKPISWVLFDVGNVLVCDDPSMAMLYRMIHDAVREVRPETTFHEILAERERLIREERQGRPWSALAKRRLGNNGWRRIKRDFLTILESEYEKYNIPVPGADSVLASVSERYRLAVAANQTRACRLALERLDWMRYFSEFWISEEVGASKPSQVFFTGLLGRIQCPPEECVMIGDRIDADITPAKALGMHAILVKSRFDELERPVFDERDQLYYENLGRVRVGDSDPAESDRVPDVVLGSLSDLPDFLTRYRMEPDDGR